LRARLFLITPRVVDSGFASQLEAALAAGDVASLLIAPDVAPGVDVQAIAETLVPIAQRHDVAALVLGDSRVMGRARADGIHIEAGGAALKDAIETLQPKSIVGAGNLRARHEAMEAGEAGADYIFFGLLDLEEDDEPHRKTIDLGAWWAEVFEPPCVLLAGRSMASVDACARTGADFVAVRAAIWQHPDGPAAAIAEANAILDRLAAEHSEAD
jgi:thiamine-phosphate pyrophosphorylase